MPTQIFSLRIMDDDDDDDDVRKQIDGAFPLSLLRLPTQRPSILSNSRRRHRISVVLNGGAEDFFQRVVVVFRVFSTSMFVALFSFFSFAKNQSDRPLWDLFDEYFFHPTKNHLIHNVHFYILHLPIYYKYSYCYTNNTHK